MSTRRQLDFVTPWANMKAFEEVTKRMFALEPKPEPIAPPGTMTYFGNRDIKDARKHLGTSRLTAYDRLHDKMPFDPSKARCDRTKPGLLRVGIYEDNRLRKIPILTEHWYGRPNRAQVDYPDDKYYRTNKIEENLYRKTGVNLPPMRADIPLEHSQKIIE